MPRLPLDVTPTGRKNLARFCSEWITHLESEWRQDYQDQAVWSQWYEAQPQAPVRNYPWPNASNIVLPVIRMHVDSLTARAYETLFSYGKLWSGRVQNEKLREPLTEGLNFLNWAHGVEFDLEEPVWDWMQELHTIGRSTLWVEWSRRHRWVLGPGTAGRASKKPQYVKLDRGPLVYHVPAWKLLYPVGEDPRECQFIARQSFQSWSRITSLARELGWNSEAVAKCEGSAGVGHSLGGQTHNRTLAASDTKLSDDKHAPHDIREIWADVPMGSEFGLSWAAGTQGPAAKFVKLRMFYHGKTKELLSVEAAPNGMGTNPCHHAYYRKRHGHRSGIGVAKILEHLQRGMSTLVNQAYDAVTLSNSLMYRTDYPQLQDHTFNLNSVLYVPEGYNLEPIQPNKQIMPDITLMQQLNMMAERAIGNSDPLMGRESRSGGHPSPATNFLGMQQIGRQLQSPTMKRIRRAIGNLGLDLITMYQFNDTDLEGKLVRYLGDRDAEAAKTIMLPQNDLFYGNMQLDIFAVDDLESPQARQQKAIAVGQMTNNVAASVLPMLRDIFMVPNMPPELKAATAQFIEGSLAAHQHFLEAFDIDDIERFTIKMEELIQHGIGNIAQYRSGLGQLAPGGAGGPLVQPGGGGGNVPGIPGVAGASPGVAAGAGSQQFATGFTG